MTYSCSDFVDTIVKKLNVTIPIESADAPDEQASIVVAEIDRLQAIEKKGGFTHLEAEAALCIWETINDWTLGTQEEVEKLRAGCDDPHSDVAIRLQWMDLRDDLGSGEMRAQSLVVGKWLLEIYDLLTAIDENFFDRWTYDWEIVPLMLKYAIDKEGEPSMYRGDYIYCGTGLIDPFTAAQFVAQEILFWNFKEDCQREAKAQWSYEDLVSDHIDKVQMGFECGDEPAVLIKWLGEKYDLTTVSEWKDC